MIPVGSTLIYDGRPRMKCPLSLLPTCVCAEDSGTLAHCVPVSAGHFTDTSLHGNRADSAEFGLMRSGLPGGGGLPRRLPLPGACRRELEPGRRGRIGARAVRWMPPVSGWPWPWCVQWPPCWAATAQVSRAGGARGPLTLRGADDEGRGLKGSNLNEQPKSYPMYWWLPTDRPNLRRRLGSRKGAYCPKWEV
jgi:hypothetical protein